MENKEKTMKKNIFFIVLFVLLLLMIPAVLAENTTEGACKVDLPSCADANATTSIISSNATNLSEDKMCIYFFYGTGCSHCAKVEPLIQKLAAKYPQFNLKSFEIYFNSDNQKLFNDFMSRYGVDEKSQGIPAVFISNKVLIGEKPIANNLENEIKNVIKNGAVCPLTYNMVEGNIYQISPTKKIELTLPAVISAALIDSINPCAFSVLIFLLVYLMALGARKRILKIGLTYIIVVFIVYFLSGLGLFSIIQTTHLTKFVYYIAAVIAILAGLVDVKDFFWYGKGFSLEIPESRKGIIEKNIKKASIPAAIMLGILVSLFELPCTGGVYLAILSLLSTKMTLAAGIPYLLLYNLIFVLPLFVILFIVYKGVNPERAEKWRLEKRKWMKLAMGLLMIILGIIMLLGWR